MSDGPFDHALKELQQKIQNPKSTLQVLITVRKYLEWPKNRDNIIHLRETGGLKEIVHNVKAPQKRIVDVCLSILGNCMMDQRSAREVVVKYNILCILEKLLISQGKDDSINGRTFRIIGNMCHHYDQWDTIIVEQKPKIVEHIVDCLNKVSADKNEENEKITDGTVLMALKSLRELLNSNTITKLVKDLGVLKAVGCLLIKYSKEWEKTKQHEKIITDIIKLLSKYSGYKFYDSIMELRNTNSGDSFINLVTVLPLAPKVVVKIIMNFINMSKLKSELPIPEICDKFMEVLEPHYFVKDFDSDISSYLYCLCYLFTHPANTNSERGGKCIPLLIKILKQFKDSRNKEVVKCCHLLLSTLIKFRYNDVLLLEQLKCGIVEIITEKLRWVIEASKHVKNQRKRKLSEDEWSEVHKQQKTLFEMKFTELKEPRSPGSSDEEFVYYNNRARSFDLDDVPSTSSPCSSPAKSVFNEYDSDNDYSPVCTDVEDEDVPISVGSECAALEMSDEEDLFDEMSDEEEYIWNKPNHHLLALLEKSVKLTNCYTYLHPSPPNLASADLILTLVECCQILLPSRDIILNLLEKIVKCHMYLLPLMQTQLAEKLYLISRRRSKSHRHHPIERCTQFPCVAERTLIYLSQLAETGAGRGDITHKLIRGDERIKKLLVLSIPYVIRKRFVLNQLMVSHGGLDLLFQLLNGEDHQLTNRCVTILSTIASEKVNITNPKKSDLHKNEHHIIKVPNFFNYKETFSNEVTFKCDSCLVKADRDFLIEKSDYFSRMLNGNFKESCQDEIELFDVDARSLHAVFYLLRQLSDDKYDYGFVDVIDVELLTLLDVIALCDRFLLSELCLLLTDCVQQFRLTSKSMPIIYRWAISSGTNLLRVESIAYGLIGRDMGENERIKMFRKVFQPGYKDDIIDDMREMLVRALKEDNRAEENFRNCMEGHVSSDENEFISSEVLSDSDA